MKPTITNVQTVVEGMRRIAEALPEEPADAMAALTFTIVELAAEADIPIADVYAGIAKAFHSRSEAKRGVLS